MDTLKPFHIICEDIFKIYKIEDLEVVALRGLDLKVRQGEVVAIVAVSYTHLTLPTILLV